MFKIAINLLVFVANSTYINLINPHMPCDAKSCMMKANHCIPGRIDECTANKNDIKQHLAENPNRFKCCHVYDGNRAIPANFCVDTFDTSNKNKVGVTFGYIPKGEKQIS